MELSIIVCIKSVLLKTPGKGGKIVRNPETCALNPFDRPALETALALVREHGGAVTALSMGPEASKGAIYEAMAMGADKGVLLSDPALAESDTFATAVALAGAIKKSAPFDLLLFGARTADSDTGQVGSQTAVLLGLPLVTMVEHAQQTEEGITVCSRADGFVEEYSLNLPGALTIHPMGPVPRDVGLSGISRAFEEMEITTWNLADVGLQPEQVGLAGSPTEVLSMAGAAKKRQCEFIGGPAGDQARELIEKLVNKGLLG